MPTLQPELLISSEQRDRSHYFRFGNWTSALQNEIILNLQVNNATWTITELYEKKTFFVWSGVTSYLSRISFLVNENPKGKKNHKIYEIYSINNTLVSKMLYNK